MPYKNKHLVTQIGNMGVQVASEAVGSLFGAAEIPFKFSQGLLSTYSIFFMPTLTTPQKITQGIQAALAFGQTALYISMMYSGNTCATSPPTGTMCITNSVLTLLYSGILLASTGVAAVYPESAHVPPPVLPHVSNPDASEPHASSVGLSTV